MSKFEQMSALESLVGACKPIQLRHLQSIVEPLLQKDFITLLPREVCLASTSKIRLQILDFDVHHIPSLS